MYHFDWNVQRVQSDCPFICQLHVNHSRKHLIGLIFLSRRLAMCSQTREFIWRISIEIGPVEFAFYREWNAPHFTVRFCFQFWILLARLFIKCSAEKAPQRNIYQIESDIFIFEIPKPTNNEKGRYQLGQSQRRHKISDINFCGKKI